VGDAQDHPALAAHQLALGHIVRFGHGSRLPRCLGGALWTGARRGARAGAQARASTRQPLVPPKPKLLDITVSSGRSRRSRTIGRSAKAGSSVSMLALSATKPPAIMSRQ